MSEASDFLDRTSSSDRRFLCPGCSGVSWGPLGGGLATCAQCGATTTLPERSFLLAPRGELPMPSNHPEQLARLRLQDGRPRLTPPTLSALLGGDAVLPGREAEALTIWNHLRARASRGDLAAGEDLTALTLLLVQSEGVTRDPELAAALSESALDAVVLPRHRQEQLGRLARLAVAEGDRAHAVGLIGGMSPSAAELEADSEYRVSYALLAALDRDGRRILELVGPNKDVFPIADSHDDMVCILRAHAHELVGDVATAVRVLHELSTPRTLTAMQSRFPLLALCAESARGYVSASREAAARRAASQAGGVGIHVGSVLTFAGLLSLVTVVWALATHEGEVTAELVGELIPYVLGSVCFFFGLVVLGNSVAQARRARRLRMHGVSLTARIVAAVPSGTRINHVPLMRFTLQVFGPSGPYEATLARLAAPHEVAGLVGQDVRVMADPEKLTDVVFED